MIDSVIRKVIECCGGAADAMQSVMRRTDFLVARVGGEEFAMILPAFAAMQMCAERM